MPDRVTRDDRRRPGAVPRRGPCRASTASTGFELVAEVDSGEEAVAASASCAPDLVLMDINMGALDGIEATRLITGADPRPKVILVSTYALDDLPPDARTSGADRLRQQGRAVADGWSAASGKPAATRPG